LFGRGQDQDPQSALQGCDMTLQRIHCLSCNQSFYGVLTPDGRCPACGGYPDGTPAPASSKAQPKSDRGGRTAPIPPAPGPRGSPHGGPVHQAIPDAPVSLPLQVRCTVKGRTQCQCGALFLYNVEVGNLVRGWYSCPDCKAPLLPGTATDAEVTATVPQHEQTGGGHEGPSRCIVCSKDIRGQRISLFPFMVTDVRRLERISMEGPPAPSPFVSGWLCSACGAAYCPSCAKKTMHSWWSGYEKSKCLKCGKSFRFLQGLGAVPHVNEAFLATAAPVTCWKCSRRVDPWLPRCECGEEMLPTPAAGERLRRTLKALIGFVLWLGICFAFLIVLTGYPEAQRPGITRQLWGFRIMLGLVSFTALAGVVWFGLYLKAIWCRVRASQRFLARAKKHIFDRPSDAANDVARALLSVCDEKSHSQQTASGVVSWVEGFLGGLLGPMEVVTVGDRRDIGAAEAFATWVKTAFRPPLFSVQEAVRLTAELSRTSWDLPEVRVATRLVRLLIVR